MKRLLSTENVGGRTERHWLHTGDHGQECFTVETVQDVEPVFDYVKRMVETRARKSDFRYRGTVPFTMIDELSKEKAALWGISVVEAFEEIMNEKSDRGQKALKILTQGRDYRKLQASK